MAVSEKPGRGSGISIDSSLIKTTGGPVKVARL